MERWRRKGGRDPGLRACRRLLGPRLRFRCRVRVVTALVAGNAPGHDLPCFRPSRFSDGSRLELGPLL